MERQQQRDQQQNLDQQEKLQKLQPQTRISLQNKTINQKYHIFQEIRKDADYSFYIGIETNREYTRKLLIKAYDFQSIEKKQGFQVKQIKKRVTKLQQNLIGRIKSRHIPKFYDICEINKCKVMIFDYHSVQTLSQKVQKKVFSELQAILTLKQIIKAVCDLNQSNWINISLTPDSIVYDAGVYKLIQFGLQYLIQQILRIHQVKNNRVKGFNRFIAPEIHERKNFSYLKAQVWTIGMMYFFMLFGDINYEGEIKKYKPEDQISVIYQKKDKSTSLSKHTWQFIKKTLELDPAKRMKFDEMLHHPIFDQHKDQIPQQIIININISNLKVDKNLAENKYNVQKLKEQLLKQLQEPYQLSYSDLYITEMQRGNNKTLGSKYQKIKKPVILYKLNNEYLNCLKANWIYENIFKLLTLNELLNQQLRYTIQFKYLIITRCFYNISNIEKKLAQIIEEAKEGHENRQSIQDFVKQIIANIRKLEGKINKTWRACSDQLFKKQSQTIQILKDKFKTFFYSSLQKTKDKIFTGLQNADYTRQQQISYTVGYYSNKILQQLKKIQDKSIATVQIIKKAYIIQKHMNFYKKINQIQIDQSNCQLKFSNIVRDIQKKYLIFKEQISAKKGLQHDQKFA